MLFQQASKDSMVQLNVSSVGLWAIVLISYSSGVMNAQLEVRQLIKTEIHWVEC